MGAGVDPMCQGRGAKNSLQVSLHPTWTTRAFYLSQNNRTTEQQNNQMVAKHKPNTKQKKQKKIRSSISMHAPLAVHRAQQCCER